MITVTVTVTSPCSTKVSLHDSGKGEPLDFDSHVEIVTFLECIDSISRLQCSEWIIFLVKTWSSNVLFPVPY